VNWQDLPKTARAYFIGLLALASGLAFLSMWMPFRFFLTMEFLTFLTMGCITAYFNIKIPLVEAHFSVDSGFIFAILVLFGIFPAVLSEVVSKTVFTAPKVTVTTRYKIGFNIASGIVSIVAAGLTYRVILSHEPGIAGLAMALIGMSMVYFMVNTYTVAGIIAICGKAKSFTIWKTNFAWTIFGYLTCGSICAILFVANREMRSIALVMSIPIVLMAYFGHMQYLKRSDSKE
jgi:hypothetical protein